MLLKCCKKSFLKPFFLFVCILAGFAFRRRILDEHTPLKAFFLKPTRQLRDCSLFMPKGGGVGVKSGGGGKIFKINEKEGCFFKIQIRGGKLLETVVLTLV